MWDCVIESVEEHNAHRDRMRGANLAHCMGLGKSLSTITLVHTILTHVEELGMRTCLVICPVNTLLNWHREWREWMPEDSQLEIYELATVVANKFRTDVIARWQREVGRLCFFFNFCVVGDIHAADSHNVVQKGDIVQDQRPHL